MKVEQKIVIAYTFLGIISGILTNVFPQTLNLVTAVIISFTLYFLSLPILMVKFKDRKTKLFYNSFVTFVLVWLTVWILLYNLSG